MKNILNVVLSASLVITPFQARSGDIMNQAVDQISKIQAGAKTRARGLVEADLRRSLDAALVRMASLSGGAASERQSLLIGQLRDKSKKLEQDLALILKGSESEIAQSQQLVEKAIEEVENMSRSRFEISFLPAEIDEIRLQTIQAVRNSIEGFQAVCATGKSHISFNFTGQPLENIPDPAYEYHFQIGHGPESSSSIKTSTSGPYQSRSLKDTQNASQYLNGAAGVSASFALSGGAMTGLNAAVAAAAPMLVGAAVVVAVAIAIWDASERNEFYQEIADAEMYKFNNTPRDVQVATYYREGCQTLSSKLQDILNVLDKLENPNESARLMALAMELKPELDQYDLDSIEMNKARKLYWLATNHKGQSCVSNKETDTAKLEAASCFYDEETVWFKHDAETNVALAKLDETLKTSSERIKEFHKKYTEEKIMKFAESKMTLLFSQNLSSIVSEFTQIQWQELDRRYVLSLRKLNRILGLVRQAKFAALGADDAIKRETENSRTLFELQAKYRTVVGRGVGVVFGRRPKDAYLVEVQTLAQAIHAFYKAHASSREAQKLNNMAISLNKAVQVL